MRRIVVELWAHSDQVGDLRRGIEVRDDQVRKRVRARGVPNSLLGHQCQLETANPGGFFGARDSHAQEGDLSFSQRVDLQHDLHLVPGEQLYRLHEGQVDTERHTPRALAMGCKTGIRHETFAHRLQIRPIPQVHLRRLALVQPHDERVGVPARSHGCAAGIHPEAIHLLITKIVGYGRALHGSIHWCVLHKLRGGVSEEQPSEGR
mmetsp:Transcript_10083/g.25265  ORF Transcript_10083/g.25265 Transcript_10083/m.25265 type:complete len:206 (+) Transcript_10083:570-1187(+)